MKPRFDRTEAAAAAMFIGFGLWFALQAMELDLGTPRRMGPGFFPLGLAAVLILLGMVVLFGAFRSASEPVGGAAWRGLLFILPAPVFFGLTVRGLGFVAALFLTAVIAGQASQRLRWWQSLLLAAAITLFSTLVFSIGLGLPFRLVGPWLGG